MNRQNHLAQIHILKKEANLNDEDYRNLLFANAGVRSAASIDDNAAFSRVINALLNLSGSATPLKDIKITPKFNYKLNLSSTTLEDPWTWYDATPEQWARMGELIEAADKKGWSLVAVWGADRSKKFKMRYKQY